MRRYKNITTMKKDNKNAGKYWFTEKPVGTVTFPKIYGGLFFIEQYSTDTRQERYRVCMCVDGSVLSVTYQLKEYMDAVNITKKYAALFKEGPLTMSEWENFYNRADIPFIVLNHAHKAVCLHCFDVLMDNDQTIYRAFSDENYRTYVHRDDSQSILEIEKIHPLVLDVMRDDCYNPCFYCEKTWEEAKKYEETLQGFRTNEK